MQRFEDARRLALDLLRQSPNSAQGYVFLGDALNGLHQDGPAYDAYLLALQWTPHLAGAQPPAYVLDRMSELDDRASRR
jgi:cytochrome c-type biogenesis protein CcmH/NrfG